MTMQQKRRKNSTSSHMSSNSSYMEPAVVYAHPAEVVPVGIDLVEPDLDEIPNLVLVELQKEDPGFVVEALKKLCDKIKGDYDDSLENKMDALSMGAAGVIVRVMRKWQMHQYIQQRGCNCLLRLAIKSEEGTCAIIRSGGVEAIVNAMRVMPKTMEIQRVCCCALRNIFYGKSRFIQKAAERFAEEMSGLSLVLKAMKHFPGEAKVQEHCCALFHHLASSNELCERMVEAGALSAVSRTMEKHSYDPHVKKEADKFMARMYAK